MAQLIGFNPSQKLIAAAPASSIELGPNESTKTSHNEGNTNGIDWAAAAAGIMDKIFNSVGYKDSKDRSNENNSRPGNKKPASMMPPGVDKEWKLGKAFTNIHRGTGLVAKEFIPSGSKIYCDKLVVVSETEREMHSTPREFDTLISRKVAAQGAKWQKEFTNMPNTRETLGPMGDIWEAYHLPMSVNGEPCEMLGLNLAFTNHSCFPNSALTVYYEYPTVNGVPQTNRKPKMGGAVVKSYFDILEGQEITVSYFYSKGDVDYRRLYSLDALGFRCSCPYCLYPDPLYDMVLDSYARINDLVNSPFVIRHRPELIFQAAYHITGELIIYGIVDPRAALIWMKCAMVAGFHSDMSRARTLLSMSLTILEATQGSSGYLHQRASNWLHTMSIMPGFGTSLRGLSSFDDASCLVESTENIKTLLFMAKAKKNEWVPVRCRLHAPANSSNDGHKDDPKQSVAKTNTENVGSGNSDVKEKEDEIVKKPKPKPKPKRRRIPKHMEKVMPKPRNKPAPKPPPRPLHKPIEKIVPNVEPIKTQGNKKKKKKPKACCKCVHEKCKDPEHDFLTLWTRVVNNFIDFAPSEQTGKDKNTGDGSILVDQEAHDVNIQDFFFAKEPILSTIPSKPKPAPARTSGITKRAKVTKKPRAEKALAHGQSGSQGSMHSLPVVPMKDSSPEKS